ncbi:MAG: hypothetical protein F8N38_13620 [Hungatella sp.]|nr:hypothetical protein [Hungatella sp.]
MKTAKKGKILVALTCAFLMTASGSALAANHGFTFKFTDLTNKTTSSYAKSDNSQIWYLSLDNSGSNNMSSANIFGCKMNRTSNNNVDIYHTFSNYVSGYGISYQSKVYKNDNMYMGAKKDSASTSTTALTISGRFAP